MPKFKDNQFPSYRKDKQSGQGILTSGSRDYVLGPFGSEKYDRVNAEWLANGRRAWYERVEGVSVSCVIAEFRTRAQSYCVNHDGRSSEEATHFRLATIDLGEEGVNATPSYVNEVGELSSGRRRRDPHEKTRNGAATAY